VKKQNSIKNEETEENQGCEIGGESRSEEQENKGAREGGEATEAWKHTVRISVRIPILIIGDNSSSLSLYMRTLIL
jgi:hypothetical protein